MIETSTSVHRNLRQPASLSGRLLTWLRSPSVRRMAALVSVLVSAIGSSGCAMSTDNQSTFDIHGPIADMQLHLFYTEVWVCVAIFSVVGTALVYTVLRYRVSEDPKPEDPLPPQSHGNRAVEYAMVLVSLGLLMLIAVPTYRGIKVMHDVPGQVAEGEQVAAPAAAAAVGGVGWQAQLDEARTKEPLVVDVHGKQWWWQFEYPNDQNKKKTVITANELVVPVGRPIVLNLKADDVIHSFWVPKLGGKMDVIPGQHNQMYLVANDTGLYYGQCAEYCGDSHANMRFRVRALYDSEFKAWLARQNEPAAKPVSPLALKGYELFMQGPKDKSHGNRCSSCHYINGTDANQRVGPDLSHFAARSSMAAGVLTRNDANIHEWLKHPGDIKPGNKMLAAKLNLSDDEIEALTAYLDTLY
jgi:cytochrome c oxidase subunit II